MASDPEIINNYYDLLECTLCDNDLMDKPPQIFNFDEMGMPLDPTPPLIVARRGQKHPSTVGSGDKSQITVLSCCSAFGYALPPFVIFDRQRILVAVASPFWLKEEGTNLWFLEMRSRLL